MAEAPKDQMLIARAALVARSPFFGSLALALRMRAERNLPHNALAGIDGVTLFYHPERTNALTKTECVWLIAHEVMHCALQHHLRIQGRDHILFNVAADFAINLILEDTVPGRLEGSLFDYDYSDMSTEAIYEKLRKDGGHPPQPSLEATDVVLPFPGRGQSQGQGGEEKDKPAPPGQGPPPGGLSSTELSEEAAKWNIELAKAATMEKMSRGSVPASLASLVEEILYPKVSWKHRLREFMVATPVDYSWLRPAKRFIHQGLYLPSLRGEALEGIIVAVDTSGSVSDKVLQQFAGEIKSILDEHASAELTVVYCDAKVQHVQTFSPHDHMVLEVKGRGGTRFEPVFEWIEEEGREPKCVIYLTDLMGSFPEEHPAYPVLWVSVYETEEAPFGETIYIDPEE